LDIFDRLGNLIKTILDDDPGSSPGTYRGGFSGDPDMQQAWEELESFMTEDEPTGSSATATPGFMGGVPEYLRKDFRNLEVPFGAPLPEVRKSYKSLMTAFHPDRHSADPEKFRTATEVTKKLNQSFQRIRAHYETSGSGA